uniref:Ig-like domain-containing protein n=1 Tax=Oncorhynchus kisutch TaxID=8019 RepID=A0A8C7DQC4_ONCKI
NVDVYFFGISGIYSSMMYTFVETLCKCLDTYKQLVVPPDPVVTSAGHDVILPCHLSPQTSAVNMDIRWFKEGEFASPLYLYDGGKVTEGKGYDGRVSMFTQELEKGNISLLLNNVMASERGIYKCHASYMDWIQELPVVLQVKQQGSVPRISMRKHHRVFIQLSCSSENWYPEPDMLWTDSSGKEITSAETERPNQKEGGVLYSITSHMRIGMDKLEGITCVVMSQYQGTKMESKLNGVSTPHKLQTTWKAQLVVPPDPVVTSAGHDVILPCHLSPQTSAVGMDIRWFKEGEFASPLYLYLGGKVTEGKGYEGRVSVSSQELEKGNISLLLNNVMASERGSYKCQASYMDWIQELPVVLQVKQQGSVPRISMRKHHRVFIQLSCSSENWYPEPDMLWTDSSGKEITSAETERPKQKEGGVLYSITSHMRIGMDKLEGITCVVMSQNQETKMESALQMTGEFRNFRSQLTVES